MIPDDGNFRSINWMTLSPCQNAPPQDKGERNGSGSTEVAAQAPLPPDEHKAVRWERHPRGHFVGPCWPILSHKIEKMRKMGKPQNTVNCGTSDRSAHRGQGRRQAWEPLSPASYGEDREKAYGSATAGALWAPGRILELTLIVGSAGLLDPGCHRRVGLKAIIEWGPAASETYSLCFLNIFMDA